jgi:hypothetical protein
VHQPQVQDEGKLGQEEKEGRQEEKIFQESK